MQLTVVLKLVDPSKASECTAASQAVFVGFAVQILTAWSGLIGSAEAYLVQPPSARMRCCWHARSVLCLLYHAVCGFCIPILCCPGCLLCQCMCVSLLC